MAASVAEVHARRLEAKSSARRCSTGRHHDQVDIQAPAIVESATQFAAPALDAVDSGMEPQLHPLGPYFVRHETADARVEAAQEEFTSIGKRNLGTQSGVDAGELHGDVAAADDQDPFRKFVEIERLVGRDRVFVARERRHDRPAARRDEYVLRRQRAARHPYPVGSGQDCPFREYFDAGPVQQAVVDAVQALDLPCLVVAERGPIKPGTAHIPAVRLGVVEVLGEVGAVDKELLGDAPDVHASAAQVALFRDSNPGTESSRHAGRPYPSGARADYKEVVVVVPHHRMVPSPHISPIGPSAL